MRDWLTRHKFCSRGCAAKYRKLGQDTRFSKERHFIPETAFVKGQRASKKTEFKKGHTPWSKLHPEKMPIPWNKGKRHPTVTGEKNSNWKGGISSLNNKLRHCPEMNEWRSQIFKRDNYTCVLCGRKRKVGDRVVLNADHHPKPYYLILKENNVTTFDQALACKELWNIKKGRTLCIECHTETKGINQYIN